MFFNIIKYINTTLTFTASNIRVNIITRIIFLSIVSEKKKKGFMYNSFIIYTALIDQNNNNNDNISPFR